MSAHILITGQDGQLGTQLQSVLSNAGYRVTMSKDAVDGLSRQQAAPCALVLFELKRPSLDGLEVLSRLRGLPEGTRPAIVVLADVSPHDAMEMAASLGVAACLPIPVDATRLLQVVAVNLRHAGRATASTWYIEDEPVEPMSIGMEDVGLSEPEDPDSVTFR